MGTVEHIVAGLIIIPGILLRIVVEITRIQVIKLRARDIRTVKIGYAICIDRIEQAIQLLHIRQLILRGGSQLVTGRENKVKVASFVIVKAEVDK